MKIVLLALLVHALIASPPSVALSGKAEAASTAGPQPKVVELSGKANATSGINPKK